MVSVRFEGYRNFWDQTWLRGLTVLDISRVGCGNEVTTTTTTKEFFQTMLTTSAVEVEI